NVLCPGCGGVLDASATLKTVNRDEYVCALCAEGYAPTLDDMVEVTFTLSRRIRRIAAHEPDELPIFEYMRQIFGASGIDLADCRSKTAPSAACCRPCGSPARGCISSWRGAGRFSTPSGC